MTQQERISEIILQIKQIREERDLSLQDVHDLVRNAGFYTSLSSIKRVFADGSEKQHFRYQDTIHPIVRALLGVTEETPENNDITANEIDALKNVILLKDSIIGELQKDNEALSTYNGELIEEMQADREDAQRKINYLLEQIHRLREEVDCWRTENDRKAKIIDKWLDR